MAWSTAHLIGTTKIRSRMYSAWMQSQERSSGSGGHSASTLRQSSLTAPYSLQLDPILYGPFMLRNRVECPRLRWAGAYQGNSVETNGRLAKAAHNSSRVIN